MANTDSTNTVDAKAVKRVAFVIDSGRLSTESSEQFAERLLEAAAPKPAWPSEKTCEILRLRLTADDDLGVYVSEAARAALLADPIIQEAVKLRDDIKPLKLDPSHGVYDLIKAVNEAGL